MDKKKSLRRTAKKTGKISEIPARDSLNYLIQHIARLTTVDYVNRIVETGVAPAQAYVLRELWCEEPLSQIEIAKRLDIGKASVGQTLRRLEQSDFISRKKDRSDGRVTYVYLTKKGRDVRKPLYRESEAQIKDITNIIGTKDAAVLKSLLVKLVEEFQLRLGR